MPGARSLSKTLRAAAPQPQGRADSEVVRLPGACCGDTLPGWGRGPSGRVGCALQGRPFS